MQTWCRYFRHFHFLQLGRIAFNAKRCISYGNSVRPSICPSVRPSVTRWYCTQTNENRITRSSLWIKHSTFMIPTTVGDYVHFHLKFALKVTHLPPEKRQLRPISAYNVATVKASEKSSIIANKKTATRFPTSYRWSPYVTPNSFKGWLKKRICRLKTNSLIFP